MKVMLPGIHESGFLIDACNTRISWLLNVARQREILIWLCFWSIPGWNKFRNYVSAKILNNNVQSYICSPDFVLATILWLAIVVGTNIAPKLILHSIVVVTYVLT